MIAWNFDLQEKLVNKSDFVLLPVTEDRESICKGNNRPIDALQQGKMVLTNLVYKLRRLKRIYIHW